MKKTQFNSTQGRIKLFNNYRYGSRYPFIQRCHGFPLRELDLNFLKYVSRHLYKHIGEKISW